MSDRTVPTEPLVPTGSLSRLSLRSRIVIFAVLAVACLSLSTGYVMYAMREADDAGRSGARGPLANTGGSVDLAASGDPSPTVLFRNMIDGAEFSRIAALPLDSAVGARQWLPLGCDRFHFAADRGICLAPVDGQVTGYTAYVVDPRLQPLHEIPLNGIPSRTRVSPDGRYGATTFFVTGHSYAEVGFSTETTLIDLRSGARLGNLEEFAVIREGKRFDEIDFNFWGVTFAHDANRFYATLSSAGTTYLVEGDVADRSMRVIRDNVECPSLSPDNTRIGFKKRVGGGLLSAITWRFHVLDLTTMEETPLSETRSIDDQLLWIDDETLMYGASEDLWTMPADGSGEPRLYLSRAVSPVVLPSAPSVESAVAPTDMSDPVATDLAIDAGATVDGDTITFTMTVTNHGPQDATDVRLGGALPDGLTFASFGKPTVQPTDGYGCTFQGGFASCTIGRLEVDANWSNSFTATVATTASVSTRFTVSATESDLEPNNSRLTVETP